MALFDLSSRSKPVLKWAGGKSSLLPQLINLFPSKFNRYIEPFLGGGAVFFSLRSDLIPSLVNDYNTEIFRLYQIIRDYPNELIHYLDLFANKYSEDFYYIMRSCYPENDIEKAARTLYLNKTGYNGLFRMNLKGKFNVPFGKRLNCPSLYDKINILSVSDRFQNAKLENKDFEEIINGTGEGDFIYCDPPYEPISQTSSFNTYNSGGFSFLEQKRLFEVCKNAANRGAIVAISNSIAPPIVELYKNSTIYRVLAKRSINSKGNGRGQVEEVLAILGNNCKI